MAQQAAREPSQDGPDRPAAGAGTPRILAILAVVAAPLGWLAPQGLAALAAAGGLAVLPRLWRGPLSGWVIGLLGAGIGWLWFTTAWGPYALLEGPMTGLKIAAMAVLGVALIDAGRHADPAAARRLAKALAWSAALLAAILAVEGLTAGGLFRAVNAGMGVDIRPDLAIRDAARGTYVLAVLGPAAIRAGAALGMARWLAPLIVGSLLYAAHALGADAPAIAILAAGVAAAIVWLWPRMGPRWLAGGASTLVLAMPLLVQAVRATGRYDAIAAKLPLSWAQRLSYWRFAVDHIAHHPLTGWGLDASRDMAPGLVLHPHNGALQLWLELGLPGAMLGASLCAIAFLRLSRGARDPAAAAGAATAAAYLTIGLVSFGVWQEWWIGLGLIAASQCASLSALQRTAARLRPTSADVVTPGLASSSVHE